MRFLLKGISSLWLEALVYFAFPTSKSFSILLLSLFLRLRILNLLSIVIYSYPVTTTLAFNLGAAFSCWVRGVLLQLIKLGVSSSVLPSNSPWYLVPFLCVVELVRVLVRPITLCFRLLANITAGHVLIALICKIPFVWTIGRLFGGLELMVAIVQGFVFAILIRVYFEEALRH
jgi:F-type H+-transporting ATPase subunit a